MRTVRPARAEEAEAVCEVLRQSIVELCGADHGDDPEILAAWLANKTPAQVRAWIAADPDGVLVCTGPGGIVGVGAVTETGRITLNYVAPWATRQGVGRKLVDAMEARAARAGAEVCTLDSTLTGRAFYRGLGYGADGPPKMSFGGRLSYPMRREIS